MLLGWNKSPIIQMTLDQGKDVGFILVGWGAGGLILDVEMIEGGGGGKV